MKFLCKKCKIEFDEEYNTLFDIIRCPICKKKDLVLNLIQQGIHPPEEGFGISFMEFEDVLEEGKESYLKQFFKEEFNLQFTRKGEEFAIENKSRKKVDLRKIYEKTQNDGKLQRIIYNIYYVLLQGI